ncbi:MAG: response regulator, partial [Pseudobdellovibrio sp.]
ELNFRCLTPIPSKILTDPTRYQQILINIVGNSVKFTEKGKVELDISWFQDQDDIKKGRLHCTVRDTGIGIDLEEAKNLFQPFSQVDSSKTRKFGGTGLGLALARRLAKALEGDVYIEHSEKGKGSVFGIDIHTTVTPPSMMITSLNMRHDSSELPTKSYKNFLKGTHVLVVDDSSDNRNLISQFLKGAGASVDCAVDGAEGISKALGNDYGIVLMDIQMPNVDGYKATSELRKKGYRNPIIALTAHALKEERLNSLQAGCDDHLTKPVDRKTLIEQVGKHVGRDFADF